MINGNIENKRSSLPITAKTLKNDVLKERLLLKSKVKEVIQQSTYVAISADIATTKGMRYSYMGIIAHVWDGIKSRALGLEHVELFEQHKSVYIRKLLEDAILDNC